MLHVLPERIHEKQCMRHPRALQGHKIVAGGNAPGKRGASSPDPEGVALRRAAGRDGDSTLSGLDSVGVRFPGALPPATT